MDPQRLVARVEKDQVESEAHPKGVHSRTAGDQQPGPRLTAVHIREAQQASPESDGGRHLVAEHGAARQAPQSGCELSLHLESSRWPRGPSPPGPALSLTRFEAPRRPNFSAGANPLSGTATRRRVATMTGMIQHLLSLGLRKSMASTHG